MSIKTLFFNDTDYYAEDFIKPFKSITGNGVLTSTDFSVSANSPNNLTVNVSPGKAFIEGYHIESDVITNLPITANTSGYGRIDTVCLELNTNARQSILTIIEGTPSASPVQPTIPATNGVYYITLVNILIGNNVSSIITENITDKRICKKVLSTDDTTPTLTVTSNLLLGTSSIGTTGYTKLPNGMTMQWGLRTIPVTASPNAQLDIALPVAFPTACVHCSADNARSGNAWYDLLATAIILNKTSIRLQCKNVVGTNLTGTLTCSWFAIGY